MLYTFFNAEIICKASKLKPSVFKNSRVYDYIIEVTLKSVGVFEYGSVCDVCFRISMCDSLSSSRLCLGRCWL